MNHGNYPRSRQETAELWFAGRISEHSLPTFSQNHHFINFFWAFIQKQRNLPPPLFEGVETTILEPSDAGSRESLGGLARNHDPGPSADIHIRGKSLELLVQNWKQKPFVDNFVWMFLRTNSLIWSLSLRNYRCENKHLMGYWKQTTPGMIREKEIFNDLSNICEEGEQRYSVVRIIPLCLNFGFLEVWKWAMETVNCASPSAHY